MYLQTTAGIYICQVCEPLYILEGFSLTLGAGRAVSKDPLLAAPLASLDDSPGIVLLEDVPNMVEPLHTDILDGIFVWTAFFEGEEGTKIKFGQQILGLDAHPHGL